MNRVSIPALFLISLLVAGCGAAEINKSSIPLGFGADYQDNKIIFTTQLANPSPPEKGAGRSPQFVVLSTTGATVAEAARRVSLSDSQYPLWSQSSLLLWGESLSRSDVALFMDFVSRNRFIRKNIPVVITHDATVEQVLNVKPLVAPYTATAITDLLQAQEAQLGIYTPITLMQVIDKFTSSGVDPVIPMITIDKSGRQEQLKLQDMAVFKDRKMVGALNEKESRGYRFMSPKMIQGGLFLIPSPLNQNEWVTLEMSRSQAKITPQIQGQKIKMKIEIKAEGNFYEQGGTGNLFTLPMFRKLEDSANREIAGQISSCISKAQTLDSDIMGWGQMIHRSNPKLWQEIGPKWYPLFPGVESEIIVKFEIRRSYLTDKSFVFR